jgi:hypothetical protein
MQIAPAREVARRVFGAGILLICIAVLAGPCSADFISSTLGIAGPSDFSILVGPNTTDFALNGPGTTIGNVGYAGSNSNNVQLNGSAGPSINGNLFLAGPGSYGGGHNEVTGSVISNSSLPGNAFAQAVSASNTFAGLAATQNLGNLNLSGNLTITGTAGINVIDVSNIAVGNNTLTLNGPAGSQFIINDTGGLNLNSGKIVEAGGLTNADVVINVTSTAQLQTSGGLNNESVINGILLAPNAKIGFAPGQVEGELIAGGQQVHLVSGSNVIPPVPEPNAIIVLTILSAGLVLAARRNSLRSFLARHTLQVQDLSTNPS